MSTRSSALWSFVNATPWARRLLSLPAWPVVRAGRAVTWKGESIGFFGMQERVCVRMAARNRAVRVHGDAVVRAAASHAGECTDDGVVERTFDSGDDVPEPTTSSRPSWEPRFCSRPLF